MILYHCRFFIVKKGSANYGKEKQLQNAEQ
jgi:hypothetical protein